MNIHPKMNFNPLCDLHHSPMRRVMLEGSATEGTESFHQCQRRDCNRVFRDGYGYSDFGGGEFDASRVSSRQCPTCGGTLYLAEVDHTRKIETWDCAETECDYTEDVASPSGR
jgi:ssDNA-binding Zn-finger/Zn-ribbon topoisomerase 1